MAPLTIHPLSAGLLSILVEQEVGGVYLPVTSATVTADVFTPQGIRIVAATGMSHTGNGYYALPIVPAWSLDAYGRVVEGAFTVIVTTDIGGTKYVDRFTLLIAF